ncbi:Zinc transporter [Coemansia sp. RSA 1286]|nr:Zinc transporter [Coemansia sp. RSA 1286]
MLTENSSTEQAWLFAMTSGLASALGGAALYIDPLLHAFGMPPSWNVLDSHTVLSALLAGASGIMAYTSISVLTRESIEYLSQLTKLPVISRYPGATVAVLFLLGAHLNLLLIRLVSRLTPPDSPIQHTCASHPPSPSVDSNLESGDVVENHVFTMARTPDHGENNRSSSDCHKAQHIHENERQPLLSQSSGTIQPPYSRGSQCVLSDQSNCVSRCCRDNGPHRCEYACVKPGCFRTEHCHITPLYPHIHTHEHENEHDHHVHEHEHDNEHGHEGGLPGSGAHQCHHHSSRDQPHTHSQTSLSSCNGENGIMALVADGNTTAAHATPAHGEHVHCHDHSHSTHAAHIASCLGSHHGSSEPEVQLSGPGNSTASQVSSRHQRLLIHVGLQTAVAIALHKVPEGLIIFLSRQASPKLGVSVAASLFFHNLPEGLMLALPLFLATRQRHLAFLVASLMGAVPPALGAALGMLVVGRDERHGGQETRLSGIFGLTFGITAGMMCMVALNGMLPTARIYDRSGNVVAWFFAMGVAAMLFANTTLK